MTNLLNIINKKRIKVLLLSIGLFAAFLLSRIHIELLWFAQFHQTQTLLRKWIIQASGLSFSFIIFIVFNKWLNKWSKILTDIKYDPKNYISGIRYTFYLLLITLGISFILASLFRLFLISLIKPNLLNSWWTILFEGNNFNLAIIILAYISSIIIIISKNGTKKFLSICFILCSVIIFKSWTIWSLGISPINSGIKEALFNTDVTYSIAQYSSYTLILYIFNSINTLVLLIAFLSHIVNYNNFSDWQCQTLNVTQKKHLRLISYPALFSGSLLIWLSRHNFLWKERELFTGAGWIDVNISIPIRTAISLFIFLLSLLIFLNAQNKIIIKIIRGILKLSLTLILFEVLITPIIQWAYVKPREYLLEKQYYKRAIASTRKAFQLDSIKTKLINPSNRLKRTDLKLAQSTLRNIRLWDSQPLLATNRQLQQLRVYYRFSNAAVDRYRLNNSSLERQQVMISARELDHSSLPYSSQTWLNKHFVFTHGYGFTLSPVNTKGKDGLPEYFIKDLGKSTKIEGNKSLGITQDNVKSSIPIGKPAIYYGSEFSPYAIAPSNLEELDYPQGDKNIFNNYKGQGGIMLNNILNRISSSIYLREPRLLNTSPLNKDSKLLIRRQIKQRVHNLAPFLEIIGDPYLVSVDINSTNSDYDIDQKQYWIVEGYTTSYTYPYSTISGSKTPYRYIRNSVKAIVDAYNGKVFLYITENDDPIISTWNKIFPSLFRPIDDMPKSIRDHIKVPTEFFDIQVNQLLRFHVTDTRTFYNGDDLWQVPKELYGDTLLPVEPYHITAQLGQNETSEFLLLQPLTPLARPNLSAWLAARNDGANYGELVLLRFPSESNIFGPEQIQALINQDPNISQQFSLWDRAGSEVIQGNLLVLPFGQSLLYVEPVYLKASKGGLPTLTRVVVSDGKRIAMAENLIKGINLLLKDQNTN